MLARAFPFAGWGMKRNPEEPFPAHGYASHEVRSTEVLVCWTSAAHRVHRIRTLRLFPCGVRVSSRDQPSPERTVRLMPSASCLSRVPSLSLPSRPFRDQTLCQGFVPHRDTTTARPLFARIPSSSLRSVRRFSQPLDGFLRALARGPISSRSRVQGFWARSGA